MKKLLLAGLLALLSTSAHAACSGIFGPNTYCGNNTGTSKPPFQISGSTNITGPGSSTVGDYATWANTNGTSLADKAPSALTKTDDTNVTVTLGGSATTALFNPASITMGWTGTLAAARLNANVPQAVTNDTNVTGSIAAQNLTLGWTGTLSSTRGGTGANNSASTGFATWNAGVLGSVGASATVLPLANGGTGAATQAPAATAILPTATRAGDILYWDGSIWNHLAGNNSGTQFLQETSLGVPSWATVAGTGTVTTLTSASGITFSSGATCTTTCTVSNSGVLSISYGATASTGAVAVSLTTASNVLVANVPLGTIGTYFDGPSMAQGTSGTWYASGSVVVQDNTGAANINCKLWDGTTVISSSITFTAAAGIRQTVSLSGILASPAANIRISCSDATSTNGFISFNQSGNSKDANISGFRIQ